MNMESQMMSEESGRSNITKYVLTAVIAFLIGFGSAWLYLTKNPTTLERGFFAKSQQTSGKSIVTPVTGQTSQDQVESNKVAVGDQPAGITVSVKSVTFQKSGWVVIHEDDGAGKPGKILGAQLYDAGTFADTKVDLLRGTIAGRAYFAMLHDDNGDRAFDPKLDKSILGEGGAPVMIEFKAGDSTE